MTTSLTYSRFIWVSAYLVNHRGAYSSIKRHSPSARIHWAKCKLLSADRVLGIRCKVAFCGSLNVFRMGDHMQCEVYNSGITFGDTTVYARRRTTWSYDLSLCMASPSLLTLPQGSARHPSTPFAKPFMPNENFWWTQHVTSHRDITPFLPQVSQGRADKVPCSQRTTQRGSLFLRELPYFQSLIKLRAYT